MELVTSNSFKPRKNQGKKNIVPVVSAFTPWPIAPDCVDNVQNQFHNVDHADQTRQPNFHLVAQTVPETFSLFIDSLEHTSDTQGYTAKHQHAPNPIHLGHVDLQVHMCDGAKFSFTAGRLP